MMVVDAAHSVCVFFVLFNALHLAGCGKEFSVVDSKVTSSIYPKEGSVS